MWVYIYTLVAVRGLRIMIKPILVHITMESEIFTYIQICNKFLNFSRTRQHLWLYGALVLVTLLLTSERFVLN